MLGHFFSLTNTSILCAAFISFAVSYLLPEYQILSSVIFFGQGHFLLAYIYANKYGKITKTFLAKFVILVGVLGALCFYFYAHYLFYSIFLFLTAILFTFHYSSDEFKLAGLSLIKHKFLLTLAVVCSFLSFFLERLFHVPHAVAFAIGGGGVFISLSLFYIFNNKHVNKTQQKKPLSFSVFYILNLVVPPTLLFFDSVSATQVLGFIIIFHYIRWYIYYATFLKNNDLDFYFDVVIWSNMFILATYIQYVIAPQAGILYLFYDPLFFYAWSIVHILLFLRKEDYLLK